MIRLDGGYAIAVDSLCYTLGIPKMVKQVDKKTKEETTKEVLMETKYYSTLHAALIAYWKIMRRKKLTSFEGSLREALEVVKKQDEKIQKMIESVKEDDE